MVIIACRGKPHIRLQCFPLWLLSKRSSPTLHHSLAPAGRSQSTPREQGLYLEPMSFKAMRSIAQLYWKCKPVCLYCAHVMLLTKEPADEERLGLFALRNTVSQLAVYWQRSDDLQIYNYAIYSHLGIIPATCELCLHFCFIQFNSS